MPELDFTITPAAVSQLHDALSCLARFDENISIEANENELRISSLNISKTAYASFLFDSKTFFTSYDFSTTSQASRRSGALPTWACKLQNRALLSIFKRRVNDKEKDTALEYCTFALDVKPDQPSCRLIITLHCRFGVSKTYRLTYESGEVLHATFDGANSLNRWTVSSRTLRDVVEYFGPKTEHVDWSLQNGKVTFTSYTEKIQVGKEIVRQPTHTSVTLEQRDFDACVIEHGLHVSIPVKDFRSVVAHADGARADLTATYSRGNRPLRFNYSVGGLAAEFTLMTKGSNLPEGAGAGAGAGASRTATPARDLSFRAVSQQSDSRASPIPTTIKTGMPPPSTTQRLGRQTTTGSGGRGRAQELAAAQEDESAATGASQAGTAPPATLNPDSLFVPLDDDSQWDTPFDTGRNTEDDGFVTWDNSDINDLDPSMSTRRRLLDSEESSFVSAFAGDGKSFEIQPTQRLSQVKGMFD